MADNCWHSILLVGMTDGRNRRLELRSMCESHFRAMAMFLSIGSPSGRPPHPTTLVHVVHHSKAGCRCPSRVTSADLALGCNFRSALMSRHVGHRVDGSVGPIADSCSAPKTAIIRQVRQRARAVLAGL